jgi:twitching motility protein PilT
VSTSESKIADSLATLEAQDCSDLFLTVGKTPAIRRFGHIESLSENPTTQMEMDAFLDLALNPNQRELFERLGDLDAGFSLSDTSRFRLNLSKQMGATQLVARALPSGDLHFEALGIPNAVAQLASKPRGLVLVTGATGSGKSTTLAAMINAINNQRAAHIVSIEDPIEFVHVSKKARITQREVGADTASFKAGLRYVLRQSPDVILIGEMRDQETMAVAISAALTGHLVLSTLHTIDATQTLQRILSGYPEDLRGQAAMDLSLCLQGIVSQRLLPNREGKGRVMATEVLLNTPAVGKLLREQRVEEVSDLMRNEHANGMHSFNQSLLQHYRANRINYNVGLAFASNPDAFALASKGISTSSGRVGASATDDISDGVAEVDLMNLLKVAVQKGASDLHLSVNRPPMLRVTGELEPLSLRPLTNADMRTLLYTVLNTRQRSHFELERELDFALSLEDGRRFRVNAYYQRGNMAASLRAIPSKIPDPQELGIPKRILELADKAHGLLLVVGPTGSGKTTTMACLVDRINHSRSCRIITIEDPVEYVHKSHKSTVEQREIGSDTHSFSAALKYILRQDPDVILIGEMRDYETVSSALTAAETGHLVLATLHSNDAPQTIDRIIDVFPAHQQGQARVQLASSLLGVVSQRLLPRAIGEGRVPAMEIMMANTAIRNLIREQRMHQAQGIMESSMGAGNITMDRVLRNLLIQGTISFETADRLVSHPGALEGWKTMARTNPSATKKKGFW